ncbi:hypothetical protein EUTSA_v10000417mg [Eutrema salsugineum]|uniref:DUF4408 domain-containing protein n=1 Tax=Eutrema salsugineum TaxID=72664 RepID=V4LQL5_EUTSA|nr:nucleolar protein 58 [Eutrema salsugineum]ESQ46064.1 hypothetical protein EUTSA_v10000417mg [Eutrema salsugineum]
MDSLSNQKAKPKKMKTVVKKSRVQILLDLFYRVIEITVVMVTVAKLCYQLVIMLEDSSLTRFLINRHLAFILGNAIVITIIAKCGLFVNQEPDARRNSNDFYDEFVRESSRREEILQKDMIRREKQSETESKAKQSSKDKRQSRAKQSMLENRAKQSSEDKREKPKKTENSGKQSSGEETEKKDITVKRPKQIVSQKQETPRKSYERSRSENLEGSKKSSCGRLMRSETERPADGFDSDDELRYKIESFIARQRRNQKDEEFCII